MNKTLSVATICLAAAVIVLAVALVKGSNGAGPMPKFGTPYQAVLLDNGQVYYGKVSHLGSAFPEMTDVYYIVRTEDPQTKAVRTVLVKRGKELHAPTETFLDARHIVMIEPVGTNSQVADQIAKSEAGQQK